MSVPTVEILRWPAQAGQREDLVAADREAEVSRLLAAGATLVEHREMPGFQWTTLADPDGNEFCVAANH